MLHPAGEKAFVWLAIHRSTEQSSDEGKVVTSTIGAPASLSAFGKLSRRLDASTCKAELDNQVRRRQAVA